MSSSSWKERREEEGKDDFLKTALIGFEGELEVGVDEVDNVDDERIRFEDSGFLKVILPKGRMEEEGEEEGEELVLLFISIIRSFKLVGGLGNGFLDSNEGAL